MSDKRHLKGDMTPGEELESWLDSPLGRILFEQEQECLNKLMSGLFGYFLVQIGALGRDVESGSGSRPLFKVLITQDIPVSPQPGWVCALPDELPIASDSVDVVLLSHTLDFCLNPHQVLREVERVLIPEGHLIVSGFNPWSLWGLWRLFRKYGKHPPWNGRFLSQHRLHDWLALLGFEVEKTHPLLFRPPLSQRMLMSRMHWLEPVGARWWPALSAVYVVMAVKRVSTLTPVRPAWKISPAILGGRAIEPTTRIIRGRTG